VAASEETEPTARELPRAASRRSSASTCRYQRSDGPLNGGTGKVEPWNENRTRTITGRKMKR
jgi:hypothetical protein